MMCRESRRRSSRFLYILAAATAQRVSIKMHKYDWKLDIGQWELRNTLEKCQKLLSQLSDYPLSLLLVTRYARRSRPGCRRGLPILLLLSLPSISFQILMLSFIAIFSIIVIILREMLRWFFPGMVDLVLKDVSSKINIRLDDTAE